MRRVMAIIFLALIFAGMTSNAAVNVTYSPEHPKVGEKVTFHVTADNATDVKLKYCTAEACYFVVLEKQGDEWVGNFTMPEESVEVDIIVDGNEVWNATINASTQENENNSTPFIELPLLIASIIAVAIAIKRRR